MRESRRLLRSNHLLSFFQNIQYVERLQIEGMELFLAILAAVAIIVNVICFRYAYQTFNIKLCANYIMCVDAGITTIACCMVFVANVARINDSQTACVCSMFNFGMLIVPALFGLYNFIFVYTR